MLLNTEQLLDLWHRGSVSPQRSSLLSNRRKKDIRPLSKSLLLLLMFLTKQTAAQKSEEKRTQGGTKRCSNANLAFISTQCISKECAAQRSTKGGNSARKRWENNEALNSANTSFNKAEQNQIFMFSWWKCVCATSRWKNGSWSEKQDFTWIKETRYSPQLHSCCWGNSYKKKKKTSNFIFP